MPTKNELTMNGSKAESYGNKTDLTPIHKFVVKYDIPHSVANKLIGKTEKETDKNIDKISDAIDRYAIKYAEEHSALINKQPELSIVKNIPYGYTEDSDGENGKLIQVPKEQRIIKFIIKSKNKGLGSREIAEKLTRSELKTRHGNSEWQEGVVARILKREMKGVKGSGN